MSSISYWTKSESTTIYPSLEFDKYYDYESLVNFVKTLKESLNNKLEIIIYKQNEYCFEVNGKWNVSFGVVKDGINETSLLGSAFSDFLNCCIFHRSYNNFFLILDVYNFYAKTS